MYRLQNLLTYLLELHLWKENFENLIDKILHKIPCQKLNTLLIKNEMLEKLN